MSGALDSASIRTPHRHLLLTPQCSVQLSAICSRLHLHHSKKFFSGLTTTSGEWLLSKTGGQLGHGPVVIFIRHRGMRKGKKTAQTIPPQTVSSQSTSTGADQCFPHMKETEQFGLDMFSFTCCSYTICPEEGHKSLKITAPHTETS